MNDNLEMHSELSLTAAQLDLLLGLLEPGIETDPHDGELVTSHAPTALFKQLHNARHHGSNALWLTIYEVEQAYGGPEEGGWWYDHRESTWAQGFTDLAMLRDELQTQLEYYADKSIDGAEAPTVLLKDLVEWFSADGKTPMDGMSWSFRMGRYAHTEVAVEWQLGGSDTIGKPCYC